MRFALAVLAVGLLIGVVPRGRAATADLERARRQFAAYVVGDARMPGGNLTLMDTNEASPDATRAREYARTLRDDGSWADIDYASPARSSWPPSLHYTRMLSMIAAARRAATAAADRSELVEAVHRAFGFWMRHDFTCPNWWYNQIGGPKLLATTALLLGDDLKPEEFDYVTRTVLPRAKIGMTGQNRIWLAGNTLMLGLLESDASTVDQAAAAIWAEVAVVPGEGIQPDFSFHQHGPQQQFGNYGMAFAVEICRWGVVLRGTRWALARDPLAAFRGFLLDGEAWVNWRGAMDISACGRQFMPHSPVEKATTIARVMGNAAVIDPPFADAYRAFVARNRPEARNDLVGERDFWRSDYVIHRRPHFAATLKLSSVRVIGAESLNSENLLGYHLADGTLYLYRRGDEYSDIFPVWDWQRLPGVTCAIQENGPPKFREVRGARAFVGGVTDGQNGCAALDFERDGVSARKAWFFDRDAIVCLGMGITAGPGQRVMTSVNQCLRRGPVTVQPTGGAAYTLDARHEVSATVDWVEHDGWRYTFLVPSAVEIAAGPQTGNWKRVFSNPATPPEAVTRDVFSLAIPHDTASGPQSYAYAITPAGVAAKIDFENARELQEVRFADGSSGMVFWAPGSAEAEMRSPIAVDQPSLAWRAGATDKVFVAEPTQKLARLTVTIDGVAHAVALPSGGEAGRSIEVN